jgi:fatty acid desaturase
MPGAKVEISDAVATRASDPGGAEGPAIGRNLGSMQAEMRMFLGPEGIAALHRRSVPLDICTLIAVPCLCIGLVLVCASSSNPVVVGLAMIAQGYVLQWFGLINHEFFVHRRVGGIRATRLLGLIFTTPILLSFTRYSDAHKVHHKFIGTERDSEQYKQDIDSPLKRILFCTYPGIAWAISGKMGRGRPPYFRLRDAGPDEVRHAREETVALLLFLACVIGVGILYPRAIMLGYVVPLLVMLPALNAVRILFEHAELQPDNPYFIASRFHCGVFEELAFLWDAGEFHLIHHYLPNVPYYRMRAARRALDPLFDAQGIQKTSGRLRMLRAWFIQGRSHRDWWATGEGLTARPPATR